MPKFARLKPREIIRILELNGFKAHRQSGSHRTFYNSVSHAVAVVPVHSKVLAIGTIKSIIKQSKLSPSLFLTK